MAERIFTETKSVERADDTLQVNYSTWEVTGRIWREHLKPRLRLVTVAAIAMAFAAATTGAVPFLIQRAADDLFVGRDETMLYVIPAAVVVVTLIKALSEYVANVSVGFLGHRFIADLRMAMFERLTNADLTWLEGTHSGRFLASFLNDVSLVRQTASRVMVALCENLLKVVALTAAMFWMDWRLALLILICMPIGFVVMGQQRRKMHKSTKKSLQETGDLGALIAQTLRSIRVVRAYRQEARELKRARSVVNRALEFTMRGARARAASSPVVEALTGIGFALAILYAGFQGMTGSLTLGAFMGFMAAAMLVYQPLKSLATLQTALQEGVAAASRVFGIIDSKTRDLDVAGQTELTVGKGEITFDHVTFGYGDDQPVLNEFSLAVPVGCTVALAGPSGAGKSTVLNLLLRFFDPRSGQICIDGQDISTVTISSLRGAIGLVTQDPVLFDDSIHANIAYGRSDASREDVIAAAKAAAAHDFISKLPHGYDTRAGEAGNALSGGERQRIAIARALLYDAPILLLDEPTSSLDSASEAQVQQALESLMQGRTVLMVAHRLSMVKKADVICVMDHGKIAEMGDHSTLLAQGGLYALLHETQSGAQPEDAADLEATVADDADADEPALSRVSAGE